MPTTSARAPLLTKSTIGNRQSAILLLLLFAGLILTHFPLLGLPYFWDEAGYYIPAARDLLLSGTLIPTSTMSNAHPPLLMAYLAAAWKMIGYSPLVTRCAILLVAAFTLLAVYRLACQVSTTGVAIASLICTALYPVFFSQSAMAHLDLAAAGLILWGVYFYLADRRIAAIIFFALACLAKETAALVPVSLFAWELLLVIRNKLSGCHPERGDAAFASPSRRTPTLIKPPVSTESSSIGNRQSSLSNAAAISRSPDHPITGSFALLLSLLPLCAWFAFHYARTGHVFGNPEFFRYNLGATLHPVRFLAAFALRLWHLLGYMNMFLLTLATAVAMFFPPRISDSGAKTPAIAARVQAVFYVLIVVHLVALSILGGAILARYLLPVYPLVVIVCVSTLRRRLPRWPGFVALICAGLLMALVTEPPYRFAPEDNLAWSNYVRLHQSADVFVAQHYPAGRVLTAWPASDELTRPWLGYVPQAVPIVRIEDFSAAQILAAADARSSYRAALVFSTKFEPRHLLRVPGWERLQERFFGYHRDLPPELIARL
ncbi:MAG: glycosyltransferase family 39 protein, partial [Terriglobales bacterium]